MPPYARVYTAHGMPRRATVSHTSPNYAILLLRMRHRAVPHHMMLWYVLVCHNIRKSVTVFKLRYSVLQYQVLPALKLGATAA